MEEKEFFLLMNLFAFCGIIVIAYLAIRDGGRYQ